MAKMKKGKGGGDNDLDLDDLEDFGDLGEDMQFGDEAGIDDDNREPSRSKVVTDLAKEAGEGALESVIKNTAKKALPEDYSANYHEAMDLADFTSEVITKNKMALNKSAYRLGKEVNKILPFKIGMLERYLENQQSEFEGYKAQSEEQMREASVASETASIFDKQLDVQKSLYARTEAREEMEQKERLSQNKVSNEVLANIDGNIAHQTAFTTQISKEYYKRSLELQFKSYYVQADTLKTMREHYKAFAIQFTNIEKNTGLPDFVKLRTTEALQDNMRQQTVSSIYTSLIGNSKFLERMKKKMGGFVQEKVENVTQAMDGMTDMLDMVNSSAEGTGKSGGSMIASLLASLGGETLGEKISGKISPKLKEKIKDNKIINTGANYMGTLGASASSALEAAKAAVGQKAQESEESGSWLGKTVFGGLKAFLDAGTPGADEAAEVTNKGYLTHNQAAIFDNNVHRSITEVIPMYLARILQTNTNLTNMYSQINGGIQGGAELFRYDYESRKLDTIEKISKNITQKIFKEKSVAQRAKAVSGSMITDTIRTAGDSGLSKTELASFKKTTDTKNNREALSEYIDKAAKVTGGDMSYDKIFAKYEENDELKAIVESDTNLKALIENMRKYKPKDTRETDARLSDVTRDYPIETLKQGIQAISKIAGTSLHIISDRCAKVLSKSMYEFIKANARDVTPKDVLEGGPFVADESEFDPNSENGRELIDDIRLIKDSVKRIMESGDQVAISSLWLALAGISNSLRREQDANPAVFQSIQDLYGDEVVGTGKLDSYNLREGVLKVTDRSDQKVSKTRLMELTGGVNSSQIKNIRAERASTSMLGKLTNRVQSYTKEIRDDFNSIVNDDELKKNPSKMIGRVSDMFKKHSSVFTDNLKEAAAKAKESYSGLEKQMGEFANNITDKGIEALNKKYATAIDGLTALIDANKKEAAEYLDMMSKMPQDLAEIDNKGEVTRETEKLTKAYRASKDKQTKLLEVTRQQLIDQRTFLTTKFKDSDGKIVTNGIEQLKTTIQGGLNTVKAKLKEYEDEGVNLIDKVS